MKSIRYTGGMGTYAENQFGRWILDDAISGVREIGDATGQIPEITAEQLVSSGLFERVTTAGVAKKKKNT